MADNLLRRDAVLMGGRADQNARTVPLTLSTEHPVERDGFDEILGHLPNEVDLSRSPLPLIQSHNAYRLPIGVVESLHLEGRKLRGLARFGHSTRAQEVFDDIVAGVIRNVSVGYRYLNDGSPAGKRGLRFAWQPLELSAVAVGADPHAGFMRKETTMQGEYHTRTQRRANEREREQIAFAAIPAADRANFRRHLDQARLEAENGGDEPDEDLPREYSNFRERAISTYAECYPLNEGREEVLALAQLTIGDEKATVESFRKMVLKMIDKYASKPTNTGALEADRLLPGHQQPGGVTFYGAAARVTEQHSGLKHITGPGAEQRAHRAGMYFKTLAGDQNAGRWCRENGLINERSLGTGVFSAGGALIPDILAPEILNLTEQYGVFKKWARRWPMESASLEIPVKTAGVTVSGLAEGSATPTSDPTFTNINLVAKEMGGSCRINRNLLNDSPIMVGDFVIGEFAMSLAEKEDGAGFIGDGTSTYNGMRGVITLLEDGDHDGGVVSAITPHNLLSEIDSTDLVNLMAQCPEYARKNAAWYLSATARDTILTKILMTAGGNTVQTLQSGVGPSFAGYPVRVSQVLPAAVATDYNNAVVILFGDLSAAAAFGDRAGLQVDVDPSRYVEFREVFFQVTERYDVVNHHVGTSTEAGPIVGLEGTT